ncbi:MoaD/ThiS family protein [Aestuariicella sp. G3-2]|uniref:MoaD/ThiS family protein n=1 Tax=Pseudomaricurvus albidus TaxID=2842452 RepID=UPI001C0D515F|nr:MoaD/ThiS family protein [Aestuariicella albida]MBU3068245.1 MoaD/ThiS family protein [Aestuariicella albida]
MPSVICTPRLRDVGPQQATVYSADTVENLLQVMATEYPRLSGYLLDDQRRLRPHVAIFVAGQLVPRDRALQHPLKDSDEVYIMQALSGG